MMSKKSLCGGSWGSMHLSLTTQHIELAKLKNKLLSSPICPPMTCMTFWQDAKLNQQERHNYRFSFLAFSQNWNIPCEITLHFCFMNWQILLLTRSSSLEYFFSFCVDCLCCIIDCRSWRIRSARKHLVMISPPNWLRLKWHFVFLPCSLKPHCIQSSRVLVPSACARRH
jgi:Pyruvate/2-oxoacid:ferredoxin oxidoreductase delta subunit